MDVIIMYTAMLQATALGLTMEEPGPWVLCQAEGPGRAQGS